MLTRTKIINKLKKIKPELISKYPISELALFGSYARGDNKPDSDIDILVDFNGTMGMNFFTLFHELEDAFEVKVDLVSRKGIKPRYLPYVEKNLIHV